MKRQCWAPALLALLLVGCSSFSSTPAHPPEIGSTAQALQAALTGDYALDALAIRYEIGNESWQGRTTLTVHGDGRVEVTFDRGGQHQTWQSTLSEAEFTALVRLLVDHELWSIQGQREQGVPDEARPTVTVTAEGFEPLTVSMWHGEAQEHADFGPIVAALADLAAEISGGVAK